MLNEIAPEITIIICSYNTKDITLKCLEKLKASVDNLNKPVDIIIVENGSDGTAGEVRKNYPWMKVLEPGQNLGFAKGNNLAIESANKDSKYYLFLNSDALLRQDSLKKAVEFMASHSDCDALGCKLRLENGELQPSAGFLPTPFSVATWILGIDILPFVNQILRPFHQKNINFFKTDRKIGWVMGAFLFMKREVIEKTKGFDENFFMYTEEVEWCKRMNDAGLTIWYTPSFEITHLDKSSSKTDPEKIRKISQNEIVGVVYYLKKYYANQLFWILPIIKLGLLARAFMFLVLGNKERQITYLETLKLI